MEIAVRVPIETAVTPFPLEGANEALNALREGSIEGAAVLEVQASRLSTSSGALFQDTPPRCDS